MMLLPVMLIQLGNGGDKLLAGFCTDMVNKMAYPFQFFEFFSLTKNKTVIHLKDSLFDNDICI